MRAESEPVVPAGGQQSYEASAVSSKPPPIATAGRARVVVTDADEARRERIGVALDDLARRSPTFAHGAVGQPLVAALAACVCDDVRIPAVAQRTASDGTPLPLILYGEHASGWRVADKARLLLAGATVVLDSAAPSFLDDLARAVMQAADEARARGARTASIRAALAVGQLIGDSEAMERVGDWLTHVAPMSGAATLITGETGTGKELVARAIHLLDPDRRNGPFVALNCAALSASLLESELFGHRRGAFTGADATRGGLLLAAQRGVLFLDEVGELDLGVQAKLLRVLQERRFFAVGADRETQVDVRIIAATNRSLEAMVEARTFRGDLFHRLSVLSIALPSLRDRRGDIPLLVRRFCADCAADARTAVPEVHDDLLTALAYLDFPGNVRQLENTVRAIFARARDRRRLALGDLPEVYLAQLTTAARVPEGAAAPAEGLAVLADSICAGSTDLAHALDSCERVLLTLTLRYTRSNQARAARLLGITPRAVYNKMRRLGIHGA